MVKITTEICTFFELDSWTLDSSNYNTKKYLSLIILSLKLTKHANILAAKYKI